jgi:hypothetical protein
MTTTTVTTRVTYKYLMNKSKHDIAHMTLDAMDDNERLQNWVNDLQSGMYINCVYCGHRYGPSPETPVAMADVLKEHIEVCPKHPMSKLKEENTDARELLQRVQKAITFETEADARLSRYGLPPSLAIEIATFLDP